MSKRSYGYGRMFRQPPSGQSQMRTGSKARRAAKAAESDKSRAFKPSRKQGK